VILPGTKHTLAARHWLREGSSIPKAEAARLVSTLSWRGISRIPLSHPPA